MRYSILADIYEELESTTKKLKKTEIIAGLLKKTPADELFRVVMLLGGNVYPPWEGEELGVAYQIMIKAISKATGISLENVNEKYKKSGDLGLTAEFFAAKKTQRVLGEEPLTVKKVFENLQKLGRETGGGSQERKLSMLAELFAQATPKEARYIARTVLMELRVGVAEGLVRDAIASAFELPVEIVENAWNVLPEYGEIAEIAKRIHVEGKVSILLVEQNAHIALELSQYGYVMENGRIVLDGPAEKLKNNEDVKEFYLGFTGMGEKRSYRDVKHYKRRKRWLG
jgi:DNA ligase-1